MCEVDQCRPRLAGEDAELERRGQQNLALAPPDIRDRPLEDDPVGIDEHRVVGAALFASASAAMLTA